MKRTYIKQNMLNEIKCACIINVLIVFCFTNEYDLFTKIEDSFLISISDQPFFGLKIRFNFYQGQHQGILIKQS